MTTQTQNTLQRRDVLRYEQQLCDAMQTIIPFTTHAIYFPPNTAKAVAEYLPDEDKVLIPLFLHTKFLGVFMARGLHAEALPNLVPVLPKLATLALENVLLYKQSQLDTATGLATRHSLFTALHDEIDRIRTSFSQQFASSTLQIAPIRQIEQANQIGQTNATQSPAPKAPSAGLGLVIFRFAPLNSIDSDLRGYLTDKYMQELAKVLHEQCPEHALAACLDSQSIALLLPGEGRLACAKAIERILPRLNASTITIPISNRLLRCRIFAGYAIYPHDLDAVALRDIDACAHVLLHRATLAANMARTHTATTGLSYARIIHEGGIIEEVLPLSRIRINLGRAMGVREGQHFAVHDTAANYKGELLILDAHEYEAFAECWQRADMHRAFEKGDTLSLIAKPNQEHPHEDPSKSPEPILSYRDMITHLAVAAPQCKRFALLLIDMPASAHTDTPTNEVTNKAHDASLSNQGNNQETNRADTLRIESLEAQVKKYLQELSNSPLLAVCRFSNHACMAFIPLDGMPHASLNVSPNTSPDTILANKQLIAQYAQLAEHLENSFGSIPTIGIATWPFFGMRPTDMFDAARQAVNYAQLLPYPHVGLYDSLAVTIHADALHCQGDIFNAIDAYKRALLIDTTNSLAWNSLGICISSLSQHNEARRHFEEALRHSPEEASIAYNLGAVCQTLKDITAARQAFTACLNLEPEHPYAHIRLGHLAIEEDDFDTAYAEYSHAQGVAPHSALPYRYLAEWALRCPPENNSKAGVDKAREYAHAALNRNPQDVPSLSLMARLYLDGAEDPALATSLARQCIALRPAYAQGWRILARALNTQGKSQEAREAYLRAHTLS